MGESYSKYLMRIRMENAVVKLQMSPGARMYDVARQVGFVSSKHFAVRLGSSSVKPRKSTGSAA